MALIKCPECGKEISDKAAACIHCGYPLSRPNTNINKTHELVCEAETDFEQTSRGLSFQSNGDGTCNVIGIGTCNDIHIVIPPINEKDEAVIAIGEKAFAYCRNIISVKIPNSVNKIDNLAFNECTSLSSVNIPNNVVFIGNGAFSCTALSNVKIPSNVTFIGNGAFCSSKIRTIKLPGLLKKIGTNAFSNCDSLITATIDEGIETLPFALFSECHNLTTVSLPKTLKILYGATFRECSSLENIELPEGLLKINDDFRKCSSLSKLYVPDSVISIGSGFVDGCINLSSLSIGPNLKEIGYFEHQLKRLDHIDFRGTKDQWDAIEMKYTYPNTIVCFDGCVESMLELYTKQKKSIGLSFNESGFTSCECVGIGTCKDRNIIVPSISPKGLKVNSIDMLAFSNCLTLERLEINEGIVNIGPASFENCKNLISIEIPHSIHHISKNAFLGCASLKTINYHGTKSEWKKIDNECNINAEIVYLDK